MERENEERRRKVEGFDRIKGDRNEKIEWDRV
jgi:hypothetical protein